MAEQREVAPAVVFCGRAHRQIRDWGSSTWDEHASEVQFLANGLVLVSDSHFTLQASVFSSSSVSGGCDGGDGRKWKRLCSLGPLSTVAIVSGELKPPDGMAVIRIKPSVGKQQKTFNLAVASRFNVCTNDLGFANLIQQCSVTAPLKTQCPFIC
jgi:hypothetical protein